MKQFLRKTMAGLRAWPRERQVVTLVLWVLALCLAVFLVDKADDWPREIAERTAAGKNLKPPHYFHTCFWYAALAVAALLAGLALTSGTWLRRLPQTMVSARAGVGDRRTTKVFLILVCVAVVLAAWLRWPRMAVSVYADEDYTIERYLLGAYRYDDEGVLKYQPATWTDTFWNSKEGNNHVLFTVCSRICIDVWRHLTGTGERAFSERAFRMPSLIAGLWTIAAVAWLLKDLGYRRAGVVAAFLVALHPWHLRYSAEGRGYSMAMLFVVLSLWCVVRALDGGQWRWWLGFAAAQCAMMVSYLGTIYVLPPLNGGVVLFLLLSTRDDYPWLTQGMRWVVANVLSLAGMVLLLLPTLVQTLEELKLERTQGRVGVAWFFDFWSYLTVGMMWSSDDPRNPLHVDVMRMAADGWPLRWVVLGVVPALVIFGLLRLALRGRHGIVVALAMALPALIGLLHNRVSGSYLFLWYLIFALPGVMALIALGIDWLPQIARREGIRRAAGWGLAVLALAAYAAVTWRQTMVVRVTGKSQVREAVLAAAGFVDPSGQRVADGIFGATISHAPFYLPQTRVIHRAPALERAMDEAKRTGKPFHLIYSGWDLIRQRIPEMVPYLSNRNLFEEAGTFYGLEEAQFNHYTLRFRPEGWPLPDRERLPAAAQPLQYSTGKPLFVNFGSEGWARHAFPGIMAIIEDPEQFELVGRFHGLDLPLTRVVYRYRGQEAGSR